MALVVFQVPGLGRFLAFVGVGLAGAAIIRSRAGSSNTEEAEPKDEVVVKVVGDASPDAELPMIVLLHAQGSNAADALAVLEPLAGPARIVVPVGRLGAGTERHYVDPLLAGAAYDKAMRDEALRLLAFLQKTPGEYNTGPARVIVVGLGASGPLAVALGLGAPLHVRRAFATGGAYPPEWVPSAVGPLGGNPIPVVRKLTFGAAVPVDAAAVELATKRGFDFSTMQLDKAPSVETTQKWLFPELDEFLATP